MSRHHTTGMKPRVAFMSLLVWGVFALPLPPGTATARASEPKVVVATATLSILAGLVRRVPAGVDQPQDARDGMDLGAGDRILTGPKATALVTFLNGSTVTVQPDSDVEVKQVAVDAKRSRISIKINLGTVWARVVSLLDPDPGFSLESNTATATAHDGLIGGQQNPDNSFVCWTLDGELLVRNRQGNAALILNPGEKTVVNEQGISGRQDFAYNQSVLKVSASSGVLPLVVMADGSRVAGFVTPEIEVNQVFGSFTGVGPNGARIVEVPAGLPGPFTLVLQGRQDHSFTVQLAGLYQGTEVYRQQLSDSIRKGERLMTQISQRMEHSTVGDPKTAKVESGRAAPLRPLTGPLPGKILLSPMEIQMAGEG